MSPEPSYYPQEAYYAPGWQPAPQRDPERARRRRRLVVAVAAAVVVLLVAAGAVVGVRAFLERRPLGEVTSARTATPRQLDVGHCLARLPADGEVTRVPVVPCDAPHAAEVVGTLTVRGEAWPGQEAVDEDVTAACEMDRAQLEAGFRAVAWSPSEAGWAQGDRRGLCLAWSGGGRVTGSFTEGDEVTPV